MKKIVLPTLLLICMSLCGSAAWAIYTMRLGDLSHTLLPPNPIKVSGTVTSVSPLRIGDGTGEIAVRNMHAAVGDFVVVTGDWSAGVLTASGPADVYSGPSRVQMIYVPAGDFLMGNNGDEGYTRFNELPQHLVSLDEYVIGKYEVTRGEFSAFVDAGGYLNPSYWSDDGWVWKGSHTKPGYYWDPVQEWAYAQPFLQTERHPIIGISWYEAEAFCKWAGGQLPTEEQWERAARWTGTHANVFPWGDGWDPEKCNNYFDHNPGAGGYGHYETAPVGSYPAGASPIGCMDMAGNVWEWMQNWHRSYPGDPEPYEVPGYPVLRGGGWTYNGREDYYLRCAYRTSSSTGSSDYYVGFRLAGKVPPVVFL